MPSCAAFPCTTPSRRSLVIVSSLFLLFILINLYLARGESYDRIPSWAPWSESDAETTLLANETLGFEKIYALTRGTPWRVEGLRAAANLTKLEVDYFEQDGVDEAELAQFVEGQGIGIGSATAWMSHVKLLQKIVRDGISTALIMEDDVDFDVNVRNQMYRAAVGIKALVELAPASSIRRDSQTATADEEPFGKGWDVLWLGHCGENVAERITSPHRLEQNDKIQMWTDRSAVRDEYTGFAHNSVMEMPKRSRAAIWSVGPVCTYAYAVTTQSANKIVQKSEKADSLAFDTKLGALCTSGELRCISVVPEVFHEYTPPHSEDTITSEVDSANGQGHVAKPGEVLKLGMGYTLNIVDSARCSALYEKKCFPGRMDPV